MALGLENLSIAGIIQIIGPDGEVEVDGNVQTRFLDAVGPNDEPGFELTDFNVPVGGPYTINEELDITYDLDGEGGDDPVTVFIGPLTLLTAEDGQVICEEDNVFGPSSDCDASPAIRRSMSTRVR